ncbi:hypothetical protein [Leisingera sp.]|uniref:hypothetical protein n=1 Tax=Leisingera sp. TaxID=1879318 RepID=UPI002B26C087|nr:hypothetical protein [Leisingera sp.]
MGAGLLGAVPPFDFRFQRPDFLVELLESGFSQFSRLKPQDDKRTAICPRTGGAAMAAPVQGSSGLGLHGDFAR